MRLGHDRDYLYDSSPRAAAAGPGHQDAAMRPFYEPRKIEHIRMPAKPTDRHPAMSNSCTKKEMTHHKVFLLWLVGPMKGHFFLQNSIQVDQFVDCFLASSNKVLTAAVWPVSYRNRATR